MGTPRSVCFAAQLSLVVLILASPHVCGTEFTAPITIGPYDALYDNTDIVINGTTVTIDGTHAFASVSVINGGMLTHTAQSELGMGLTVSGNVTVDATSAISGNGRGYGAASGPGAGANGQNFAGAAGHAGKGGAAYQGASGGAAYGSLADPAQLGSGGGSTNYRGLAGGAGGGLIRLAIAGTLTVDGALSANGSPGVVNHDYSGGGSGGSIRVEAATVAGVGSISANGGTGNTYGGGGGGGRICILYASNSFTGSISAVGGSGYTYGGAGTVYLKDASLATGDLVLSNSNSNCAWTPVAEPAAFGLVDVQPNVKLDLSEMGSLAADDLRVAAASVVQLPLAVNAGTVHVASGGQLTHAPAQAGVDLTVTGDMTVDAGGAFDVDGKGYPAGTGPGAGATGWNFAGGAAHGGYGGTAYQSAAGGTAYDSVTEPFDLGSGGGFTNYHGLIGGAGGGAVRLIVAGTLTVDGSISAGGNNGIIYNDQAGGGAGGSIFVTVGTLAGAGTVSADGGSGNTYGGGGGGGRIALYYTSKPFSGSVSAIGGTGYQPGGAGTIYTKAAADALGELLVNNGGRDGAWTPLLAGFAPDTYALLDVLGHAKLDASAFDSISVDELLAAAGGLIDLPIHTTAGSVHVANGGTLSHKAQQQATTLTVTGNVLIDAGGTINVDRKGYPASAGPAAGATGWNFAGGGGHGGNGGYSSASAAGGAAYDSLIEPAELGSGGGSTSHYGLAGGAGGGAIRIEVAGTLTLDGSISASGGDGTSFNDRSGGGAGGSIYLNVGTLAGAGTIGADGGNITSYAGGGGGGRIAAHYTANSFTGTASAVGGNGYVPGGAGTIFLKDKVVAFGHLTLDNAGRGGAWTPLAGNVRFETLEVTNGAKLDASAMESLTSGQFDVGGSSIVDLPLTTSVTTAHVYEGGTLSHKAGQAGFQLTVAGDMLLDEGAAVNVDGRGYAGGSGPGAGATGWNFAGGAGHGGNGGYSYSSAAGGGAYDDVVQPLDLGSGGGSTSYYGLTGGAGGGAVRLDVAGTLTVDGSFSANGMSGVTNNDRSGGGSGGSIYLTVGTLSGAGAIAANGGSIPSHGGGGAGGRVAVHYSANNYTGTFSATGGAGNTRGGAGTICLKPAGSSPDLIVGAGGTGAVLTPLGAEIPFGHLQLVSGANLLPTVPLNAEQLTVGAGSTITSSVGVALPAISISGDITVEAGAAISVNGQGYASQTGPGAGAQHQTYAAGAGYGGRGGNSSGGAVGGTTYGSETEPADFGSGGGYSSHYSLNGGAGGGAMRITAGGTLTVDGAISGNGATGASASGHGSGGGSGGSIWLTLTALAGSGTISANGGNGGSANSGGGGGGRIAIYYRTSIDLNLDNVTAAGGTGYQAGQPGTVFIGLTADITGPRVLGHAPVGTFVDPLDHLDVTFNKPIDPAEFDASDVSITGPGGAISPAGVEPAPAGGNTWRVTFATQRADGEYIFRIGPQVLDLDGTAMDQNANRTPGEDPADAYQAIITLAVRHAVLVVNVHGSSYDGDGQNVYNTVRNAGANATFLNLSSNGQAAALLQQNSYDQVWVFDLSSGSDNYPADWQAIADWFNADPSRPIICDGRMISSYWSGRWTGEGQKLSTNYYENMRIRGGGLLLGTDHNQFVAGINSINSRIGLNPFTGNFSLTYIPVDTASPLMTFPNDMGTQLYDDSTPGQTPYGLQPNGRILYTVAWHSNNPDTPGISSTIEGAIGFHVEITAPATNSRFFLNDDVAFTAAPSGGDAPYSYAWTSNIDGSIGSGPSITVNTLSEGRHTITVLATDGANRTDDDMIAVDIVRAPDLVPGSVSAPDAAYPGAQISVGWRVTNSGTADASASWIDSVYLSTDDQLGGDTSLYSAARPSALPVDAHYDRSIPVTLPAVPYGNYWIIVVADSGSAIDEWHENNNAEVRPIEIRRPPHVVSMTPPAYTNQDVSTISLDFSAALAGDDARLAASYTLLNLGADRAPGGGDDTPVPVTPAYVDGTTTVELVLAAPLPEGAYRLTVVSGTPGIRDVRNIALDGNADGVPGDDHVTIFAVDRTQPAVTEAAIQPSGITIAFFDVGGIDPASVTNAANYAITSSGGDGILGNGNDRSIAIAQIIFTPGQGGAGTAALSFSPPLTDDIYRLIINGTTSITDLAGNKLAGGDYQADLTLATGPATVIVDLSAAFDTGASSSDNVTSVASPIDVIVNRAGLIEVDFDNDGAADDSRMVGVAGTHAFNTPYAADGSHIIRATFTPAVGSVAQGSLSIFIDTAAPVTQLEISPSAPDGPNGWYVRSPSITIVGSDPAPSGGGVTVRRSWDGGSTVSGASSVTFAAPEGSHTLSYWAVDAAGNAEAAKQFQVKVDTSTPATSIQLTGDGPYAGGWYHSAVAVTLTANAGTSGIASAQYDLDGAGWTDFASGLVLNVTADGTHTIATTVTTNSGKQASAQAGFKIDAVPPQVAIETDPPAPDGGNGWFVTNPAITLTASDAGGETISEIRYWWDGQPAVLVAGSTAAFAGIPAAGLLHFYAVNANGNPGPEQTADLRIDVTAPNVSANVSPAVNGQNGWHITQPTVTLTAADAAGARVSGLAAITYRWDDQPGEQHAGTTIALPAQPGEHVLRYSAADLAGNVSLEHAVTVKYDDTTPSVSIQLDGTSGGDWYSGAVTVTLAANGSGVEIASAEIKIDAAAWAAYTEPVAVTADGSHTVAARITTAPGKTAQASAGFVIDALPPVTLLATVPASPNGPDGWFMSIPPQVKLNATDAGSSVREIHYSWNDGPETVAPAASISLLAPVGENTLHYFAVDVHDNAESSNQALIKFDDSAPDLQVTSITNPVETSSGRTLDVSWTVKNAGSYLASGSWLDRIYLSTNDQPGQDTQLGSAQYTGTVIVNAAYTRTISVKLPDGIEGQFWFIVEADVNRSLFESSDSNNSKVVGPFTVNLSPYPDLRVLAVTAPASADPGQEITVSWTVLNDGDGTASGTWTDKVYLSTDAVIGSDQQVGTFTYSASISAHHSVPKTGKITIPTVDATGDLWIVVTTDEGGVIYEHNDGNNSSISASPVNVPPGLTLTLATGQIAENSQVPLVGTVQRNTAVADALVVSLASSDPAQLAPQSSVTIPAGQVSATFEADPIDDSVIDGTKHVTITASAGGYRSAAADVDVTDDDFAALTLSIETDEIDESGVNSSVTATLSRNTEDLGELIVRLTASPAGQVVIPETVTIPANEPFVTFLVTANDDALIDGTPKVVLTATATGFMNGTDVLYVNDNDIPNLTVSVSPDTFAEGAASPAATGTVTRSTPGGADLEVRLTTSGRFDVMTPPSLIIPAGTASATFPINAVDDTVVDGTQTVTISAFVTLNGSAINDGFGSAAVQVTDDDGPTLAVSIAADVLAEGAANPAATGYVRRNTDTSAPLVVWLASGDTSEATVPATVTIPIHSDSAAFPISVIDDGVPDGVQRVTITASADGFTGGFDSFDVSDLQVPDLRVAAIDFPTESSSGQQITVTWAVSNDGQAPADGAWADYIYVSHDNRVGTDTALQLFAISGPLAVGQTYERSLEVVLPEAVGDYWFIIVTDVGNTVAESPGTGEQNNTKVSAFSVRVNPPYRASVQTDVEVAAAGTPIPLYGSAWNSVTSEPEPLKPVTIRIRGTGFRRVIGVTTDAFGEFETTFTPLPTEGGHYVIGADHPAILDDPTQDEFTLLGMQFAPTVVSHVLVPNEPVQAEVTLRNLADVPLTGIQATLEAVPDAILVQVSVAEVLPASGSVKLAYTLEAVDASLSSAEFGIRVTSAEGTVALLVLTTPIEPRVPRLLCNPGSLTGGMVRGIRKQVQFEVSNVGGIASGDVNVLLPDVPWMLLASSPVILSLQPGDTRIVTLLLDPPMDLPLTYYNGSIVLSAPETSVFISFNIRAVSEAVGGLQVSVVDDYTYYVAGAPKVAGARVVLNDLLDGTEAASAVTGESGVVLFDSVREGKYILTVSADRHGTYRSGVAVDAGVVAEVEAFISRQVVTYSWTVVPAVIEDHYRITLEAVFETNVPIPVVTIDDPFIMPLVIEGQETQVNVSVTNHGLVAAKGVKLNFGESDVYNVRTLIEEIDELPAKTTMVLPALISLKGPANAGSCSGCGSKKTPGDRQPSIQIGGGCEEVEADVIYYYLCGPDRQWHLTSMSLRPIQAALSIWECIKTALDPEAFAEARADLSNAPGFVIDIICACMDLDPCACAIMKLAAGTLAGAVQGGWAGAGLGALKNITGLWDCICIEISFGGGGSTSGGGPGPGGGGWWWPSLGGGRGRQAPPGSSTIDPWIDPIEFTMPSSPGCTPGAVKPASSDASPGTSEVAPADEEEEGVCARVRLRLQQDLVMTRSAFLGTLEIENGDEKIGLEGISVTLEFTDADHNPANDLFAVRPPQLRGISAVDGTGTLAAATRGTAEYIIIPTREAAPDVMTMYMVGGTLRYVDRGEEVVLPLFPATIRVYPDPVLELHYFWEREVCSDDPFTPEVEPAVPFSLGLAITNTGKGTARDVRIISGQPQIVENEKGLLIDFKIIATEVGGDSVQPSLTAFFGTIDPSKTAVARWLMTSTLQGRFIEYSATFEHLDAIGDKHISLIDSVAIHELIHVVRVDKPQDDGLFDFLANDVEDDDHLPDCVYLSAGGSLPVTAVTEATVDVQQAEGGIVATVTAAMPEGWAYLRIPDPGQHVYKLTKVSRADGSEVMLDCNAWTTHRVRRPLGGEPYDEDRLHIFDFNSSGSYTLEYETDWAAIDHTPPISSVGPLPDVSTSGQIAVQWSGEDDASGISFFDVFVSVSGGPFVPWRTRTTQTGAIYSGTEKNTYAFYSVATDVAGNREGAPAEPDTLTYVPDMTPPAVTLGLAAASDSGVAGDRITNIVTPALAGSTEPQATVAVAITGPADYSAGGTTEADEAGRWSFAIPAGQPMAADGSYHVTASAVDTAGNASLIDATLDITIDRTPPTSTATAPSGNVPLRFRVEWSGQDGGSGVSSYDVYAAADGGSFSLWKAQTGAASAYYGGVLDHTYEFYSVARDAAGNLEQKVPAGEAAGTVIKALPVPGDANADCSVNVLDLIFIRNHLGADAASGSNWQADMNGDTRINVLDLIYVRNRLGTACP